VADNDPSSDHDVNGLDVMDQDVMDQDVMDQNVKRGETQ